MNMEEEYLSDEEKSFHLWISNNLNYVNDHKRSIEVMKTLYMAGFNAGFIYKRQIRAEEQLQK